MYAIRSYYDYEDLGKDGDDQGNGEEGSPHENGRACKEGDDSGGDGTSGGKKVTHTKKLLPKRLGVW